MIPPPHKRNYANLRVNVRHGLRVALEVEVRKSSSCQGWLGKRPPAMQFTQIPTIQQHPTPRTRNGGSRQRPWELQLHFSGTMTLNRNISKVGIVRAALWWSIRTKHALKSLQRDKDMDTEAQKHAEAIAQSNRNYVLKIDYLGHVLHGPSVIEMHYDAMKQQQGSKSNAQTNALNPDFQGMGVGVAKGANGLLYVCELFRGKFTLCCALDVCS